MIAKRISIHGLKVTEGSRRLTPTILKIERRAQCWYLVLADARWLERDGNPPKPKACIAIMSVFNLFVGCAPVTNTSTHSLVVSVSDPSHHKHAQSEQEERIRVPIRVAGYGDECSNTPRV